MLEDQVAYLLQRYLGNYVRGLNKEALKISVWKGDVELKNMQLKPEALNALKLPVKVKAGFLGSVKLKVPWSRLGQDPVLVYLDRIFLLAEPATQVEGFSEDAVQEAKKNRIREMEMKLWEKSQQLKLEMNKSWLGSLISTIIGNLKLSISNIHIRYEDLESNPGHPFAAGVRLEKLSAVTVDDSGKETFITGGALDRIQKSVELDGLAAYFDSDIVPWHVSKPWEDLLPSEWFKVFKFGTKDGEPADHILKEHSYLLQPVTGQAKYSKLRLNEVAESNQPLHKAVVNLDDVTICLSKDGYRDILKLADNFAAFNQRLKYAHYHPLVAVKADPRSWWRYAYKAVTDQMKKASGKMSWEQVLRYARLRKRYISLYASLLKSDPSQVTVSDNKEIDELDRELNIELILQWRMLAHKFVEQSVEADLNERKQKASKSWWSFGWTSQSPREESDAFHFSEEDLNRLNKIIGYREDDDGQSIISSKVDALHTFLIIHMKHNASKLTGEANESVAALSCEELSCSIKLYPETKVFDMKLGSYQLSSPQGLIAESAASYNSLVGVFCYKPFDEKVDWSMVAKASPCYMTYLKESIDQIMNFFESDSAVSQTIVRETAAAVQMTIDEVKRTAQQQMNRALKDHARFSLDLDIAAPKITIPTDFCPDNTHATKLLLDLGNLVIRTQDGHQQESDENMYLQFDLVLSDVSAFLFDGDYHWRQISPNTSAYHADSNFFQIIDKCGVILHLQQIRLETPYYPSTRLAVQLPSLGFHFSPARYHRLMQVIRIFEGKDGESTRFLQPWNQADLEGWLSLLTWKGVGIREAVWQRRYFCLVGPFLYVLDSPDSKSYKQYISLRGKQIFQVQPEFVGNADHVLAVCASTRSSSKVVEDTNALILRCESEDLRRTWQTRIQGAIYHASVSAPISGLSDTSSDTDDTESEHADKGMTEIAIAERLFVTGVLDELKVCFSYSYQSDQSLAKVLLAEEKRLFEFRAIGGLVELSIRENDIFIGTILKSLEIEDLVCCSELSSPRYLARSFIGAADAQSSQGVEICDLTSTETDDKFYEAPDTLADVDYPMQSPGGTSDFLSNSQGQVSSSYSPLERPKFGRIAGLLPTDTSMEGTEPSDMLESFIKAKIVIYDQNSPRYNNTDKQVLVTLATLTFFCRRPTILAIMEFMNSINIEDGSHNPSNGSSSTATVKHDSSKDVDDYYSTTIEEPAIKGLLGKGKCRTMFNLTLKMAQAQIHLMNESQTKLASLSQENLLTDIKVFPSSFSIKAALGNLRISDDSLPSNHLYFWACDMRNPDNSSFVELVFTSFSKDDEDYKGYDYSLFGELSEVRIVYLNRFVQEIVGYFMGLVPSSPKGVVKLTDQVTNSEKWFQASEIEGSPAMKLDLSLKKPIILMPRRTDSRDFLRLDIAQITVKNTFEWIGGSKNEMNSVHLETMMVQVEDINLNVGTGAEIGESIIQDVSGLSVIIHRSLRDLLHQLPSTEAMIKIEELKAAMSNKEYKIITDCAVSNISEPPNIPPALIMSSSDATRDPAPQETNDVDSRATAIEAFISLKVSVSIKLVELSLYTGVTRDASLATMQISGAWLLYKSSTSGEGYLSATLQGFSVFDDREGVEQEFRLAIGKFENFGASSVNSLAHDHKQDSVDGNMTQWNNSEPVPTMLIVDVKFSQMSTFVTVCVQRPQLLVALDFLLAVVEFFVPTVSSMLYNEADSNSHILDAIFLDQSTYKQPCADFSLSPQKPLIVDDENVDHFIYDGDGGTLFLKDTLGFNLTAPSSKALIYVGNGKKLQFKNIVIKDGKYLDSCVFLGANSSYSASKDDHVYLEGLHESPQPSYLRGSADEVSHQNSAVNNATEFIIELQAVGPELTFYNTSKEAGDLRYLSNKLLHAQLDAFSRLVLKGNNIEMTADALGLTMESNGIRILEPFDTTLKYSNSSGKTNIHLFVSDIFMNFTFSILKLFLAVEDDILSFLRMTSKKETIICSHFDKVGTIKNTHTDQTYVFWRPHAPPGFAVLGDYLTPLDKPPAKGVLAVNTNSIRVKKPINFRLIWPPLASGSKTGKGLDNSELLQNGAQSEVDDYCSVWFPEAPKGYVALGCVVTPGRTPPPLSSAFCIPSSSVSPCSLRDCITISGTDICSSDVAFWRVDNSVGSFLPADPTTFNLVGKAYELRHIKYDFLMASPEALSSQDVQAPSGGHQTLQSEQCAGENSNRNFQPVASFQLIWWNQGSTPRKRLSIWRPVVPDGMVYFGDVAVKGFEPPNTCIVLHDSRDENLFKAPQDFHLVGRIKKQRGMESISFWLPQAPPGYVSLGCVASKGKPTQNEFHNLRCMRSDLVTGDQFLEESVWDTSEAKHTAEPFGVWAVGNELGTFIVRGGLKRPPRRFALKLADSSVPSSSDATVIDAKIGTFSVALFDDYGGLMVPLFNISLAGIAFCVHGRTGYMNCTISFSLSARSYNDKYEAWEPFVEPLDGFLRYQYDLNAPGAASQLRFTSTRDLNLNVSVSNTNMIIQGYASWNNLSHAQEYCKNRDSFSPTYGTNSILDTLHKRNYYIIPQNKLGQDIFIRATEVRGLQSIIQMPSGDMKAVKVPVSKNMLDSHLKGRLCKKPRRMVTVVIADAQFPRVEGSALQQFTVAIRLTPDQSLSTDALLHQQSARTCASNPHRLSPSDFELVEWNEIFFFKVDSLDCYALEMIVTDMSRGVPMGFFSASLNQIARSVEDLPSPSNLSNKLNWIDLSAGNTMDDHCKLSGKLRCAILVQNSEVENDSQLSTYNGRGSGFIQISPSKEGPWTTVRLNYSAPAACWRLGNDVVASEVSVKDGNRYVNIRSLVSVHNNTDLVLDLCLTSKSSWEQNIALRNSNNSEPIDIGENQVQIDEFFETETYNPHKGWIGCSVDSGQGASECGKPLQAFSKVDLPSGWEWIDDWHLDTKSPNTADGWVYAPDVESLRWPESSEPKESVNCARRRRWLRSRKLKSDVLTRGISIGLLQPGETVPLPLSGLTQSGQYFLQLRPWNSENPNEYSWSSVLNGSTHPDNVQRQLSKLCVSALSESEELLCCSEINGTSGGSHSLWFCVSIQATEIAKDIHSDPIQDWCLVVKSPLMVSNFLPLSAEYSILEMQPSGHFVACSRGILLSGTTVQIYSADIRKPLFLSLLPQRGWLPIHEAVLISHPHGVPSKTISLRSSISGRVVQIIIEQLYDKEHPLLAKTIRVYAPYWLGVARCPPLRFRILDMAGKKRTPKISARFQSNKKNGTVLEEITEEEIYEGYTIASALNFNILALSVAVAQMGNEHFGPVKDLNPLGDMDGSMDVYAYDADGNFLRLFISTKPCPYQSVATKVISVRPFMTFTNRIGQDIFLKLSAEDEPKVLHPSDSRISFVYRGTVGSEKLQVRLEDTDWSFPVQITKEDTISIVLRRRDGTLKFLRTEIRGYEEGSRFIVVFRLGSTEGPIRIENRTTSKVLCIRQSGFGEDAWVQLQPLSTTNFSWEDPYGQKLLDAKLFADNSTPVWKLDLGRNGLCSAELGLQFHVIEEGDITIAKFRDGSVLNSSSYEEISGPELGGNWGVSLGQADMQTSATPFELLIELGVVGISIVDHRPKELSYLYLERVFLSYSTGFDGGRTSRFKLIFGYLQLDNQLPLTLMPVLLAPEQASDVQHPVFKMTITMQNENKDGVQVYPYVYIRVTERCWRLDIHEPIIWAIVDFYNNLQLDRFPKSSTVTEVDPEIRFDLIDVSEIRLKLSLETAPGQRPHGVLGIWSPVLSAVGNAFKIQVHLRRVMHKDRFMRKSSIIPAIGNRIWRDLIHNPLHLIFSVDVIGMTSSTLASLSRGFAELSTDGQFLQLRAKQVRSRRITGVGDGIIQGTEALAQGVAFGVSGVVRKPVESARENGLLGLAHGLGRAFLGFIVQPVSGALDFFSLTVDGIGASCSKCLEVFHSKTTSQRIRNPRAIHADGVLREYCEREAIGQMVLYLGEASRHFGCTEIFKEPSKFALSDYYEEHFNVPYQRIVLVTNKRVMLLQCLAPDKMDKKPCKIMWDVPWGELMALELARAGSNQPSHLILHLKNFRRSENFVRVIKCNTVEEEREGREQAVKICSVVRRTWKMHQDDMKCLILKVPSSQRHVYFAWSDADRREPRIPSKAIISSRELLSHTTSSDDKRFIKHSITFSKIWSSEQEFKGRCSLCRKQISQDGGICSIWRPICPDGYIFIGDIAHAGIHPPNVAAVYCKIDGLFALPVGYDLVWRNCIDDYVTPVSIWHPRAPDGFVSPGCVAVAGYKEPEPDLVYCVSESLVEETEFEEQKIWSTSDSYPWACHIYQVQSDALHFVALRQYKEESEWKPVRIRDDPLNRLQLQSS